MPGTVACANCGALNDADFTRCIRCNQPLKAGGAPRLRVQPAPARLRVSASGNEPWLGRWEAESLPATKFIFALNAVVFAAQVSLTFQETRSVGEMLLGGGSEALMYRLGVLKPTWALKYGEFWRILSACFAHFGIIHFGMNMMALVHLSRLAEPAVGSVRYLIAYVGAGFFGFVASLGWTIAVSRVDIPTAGASGAIFGLMGLVLGFLWRRRDERWKTWLVQVVFMSVVFTFLISQVNHAAHFAGLGSGAVFGALFAPDAPKPSARWQRALALLLAFACVASIVASPVAYTRLFASTRTATRNEAIGHDPSATRKSAFDDPCCRQPRAWSANQS